LRQPVIAAVNGPASGGGLALALASDIRIAAASAKFNAAFVRIGLSGCDIGVSWLLPRLIGAGRSHELLLTGRLVDAAEAERIGLVNRVVADGEVLDAALATAAETPAPRPPPSNSAPGATPAFAAPRGVPPADPPLRAANRACAACRLRNRPRSSVVNCAIDTLARLVR
jgi:enoyl-CoA hydratase/carnithine racemase